MSTRKILQFIVFSGFLLLIPFYTSPHRLPSASAPQLPQKLDAVKIQVPREKAFEPVKALAGQQKYMGAVDTLKDVAKTYPHKPEVKEIEQQYQKKVLSSIGACPNGFDPEALLHSRFYKAADDKYIVQVKCYSSSYQPAYEYYLHDESVVSTKIKPLNLTEFEQNQHTIVKRDTNFIAGNSEFDSKKKELVVHQKYGDSGDCGTLGRYKFDKDELVLQQFMADFQCGDGKLQYKGIYPNRVSMKD